LVGDIGDGHRVRRQIEAGQHLHLLAQDEFFGELLGLVRTGAGVIAIDELDFMLLAVRPLYGLAVDGLIGLDRLLELRAPRGESAGEIGDQADLDDIGRSGPCR
jgi:hypothetical protein